MTNPHFSPGGLKNRHGIGSRENTRTIENKKCFSSLPITVQASLRVRKLALHSNRINGYAFRSRAALTNTNPAPAPAILVRNAG